MGPRDGCPPRLSWVIRLSELYGVKERGAVPVISGAYDISSMNMMSGGDGTIRCEWAPTSQDGI